MSWCSSHQASTDPSSFRDTHTLQLAPMPDSFDLDRGLLLAVQAIQVSVLQVIQDLGMN